MGFSGIEAWLALDLLPGVGRKTISKLVRTFGSAEAVWQNLDLLHSHCSWLRPSACRALQKGPDQNKLQQHRDFLKRPDAWAITIEDSAYPKLLAKIDDPPLILYGLGDLSCLKGPCVAVVGSRAATQYGKDAARRIAAGLVSKDFVVVSGLALGIDSEAHKSAIEHGGDTIAVKGCGLDYGYPRRNISLAKAIAQHGAVISEFPLGVPPEPGHFPVRNRIISGLCQAVVVVEGTMRSGSLVTAALALEQGREVGAVPGSIFSNRSKGAHWLIKNGAKLVSSADDIVEEIPEYFMGLQEESGEGQKNDPLDDFDLDPEEKKLLEILGPYPQHLNEIAQAAGLEAHKASGLLVQMELKDLIQSLPGQNYKRR